MAEPVYTTIAELRAELGVDSTTLPDADATKLIVTAEDLVDRLLGSGWWPDDVTGRKVAQGDMEAWQWAKLGRATMLLAARLYRTPGVVEQGARSISGPDFAVSGPDGGAVGKLLGVEVLAVLDDSGLRLLAGRAAPGPRPVRRLGFDRFLRATRHNGT